jgi:hypothetical protein
MGISTRFRYGNLCTVPILFIHACVAWGSMNIWFKTRHTFVNVNFHLDLIMFIFASSFLWKKSTMSLNFLEPTQNSDNSDVVSCLQPTLCFYMSCFVSHVISEWVAWINICKSWILNELENLQLFALHRVMTWKGKVR